MKNLLPSATTVTMMIMVTLMASSSVSVAMNSISSTIGDDNLEFEFMMDSHPSRMLYDIKTERTGNANRPTFGCGPTNNYCLGATPKRKPDPRCSAKYYRDRTNC